MDADVTDPGAATGKLKVDRIAENAITLLRLAGTIDEQFDGNALLAQVKGGIAILDLGGVEKISSFGIREWVDFAAKLSQKTSAVYFVECSPKVIDQCNMVANFTSGAKIVSFFAPYRCDYCDDERRRIVQVDTERDAIRNAKLPERVCEACGNPEYFDEDPLTFFSHLQQQSELALPDEVSAFLSSRVSFVASDKARKLRIDKQIDGRVTYVRLSGDLDGTFPREKLSEGLEGEVIFDLAHLGKIDPAGAAEWRKLVQAVTPLVEKIRLCGCPPAFVERLAAPGDLGAKTDVVSFALPYACAACRSTAARAVDVAEKYELIKFATPPEMKCVDCGGPVTCAASELLLTQMAQLPKPSTDDAVRAQLARFANEIAARAVKAQAPSALPVGGSPPVAARTSMTTVLLSAVVALVVVAGVFFGRNLLKGGNVAVEKIEASAAAQPAWIAAGSHPEAGRQLFVGKAEMALDQAEAIERADDAALDEMAARLAATIGDKTFTDDVVPLFRGSREQALADFARASTAGDGAELEKGRRYLAQARHRVATALAKSGAGLVPTERSDLYWEKLSTAQGVRYIAWARWAIPDAAWAQLAARYTTRADALGTGVLSYFPSLGWRFDATEGALAVAVAADSPLRLAGVQEGDLLLTTLDRVIHDAPAWKRQVEEETAKLAQSGGVLTLQVKRGQAAPFETRLRIDPKGGATAVSHHRTPSTENHPHKATSSVRGNIWDDNPDE
jgi:anti-anti-sigma regulatory factor